MFVVTRRMLAMASGFEKCRICQMIIAGLAVYEYEKGAEYGKG